MIGPAEAFDRRFRLAERQDPSRLGARLDSFRGRDDAMTRLRQLHMRLTGGQGTARMSDHQVMAALRRGLQTRRLAMVCGGPVTPHNPGNRSTVADSLSVCSHLAVTGLAGADGGPTIGNAPRPVTLPVSNWSLEQRIERVLRLTQTKLPMAMRAEFAALISPEAIGITVGIIVVWALSHGTPIGPAVDIVLLLVGIVALGWAVFEAASALYDFISAILGAETGQDLDRAAGHLARAISLLGVAAFAALLRKIGRTARPAVRGSGRTPPLRPRTPDPAPPPPIEIGRRPNPGQLQERPRTNTEGVSGTRSANPEATGSRLTADMPLGGREGGSDGAAGGINRAQSETSSGAIVRPADSPNYSTATEMQLPGAAYPGVSRQRHNQILNQSLHENFEADSVYAAQMEKLYPGIVDGVKPGPRGAFPRSGPTPDVTWHHGSQPGQMQLVPIDQHTASGPVQNSLHPDGLGGFANWGTE